MDRLSFYKNTNLGYISKQLAEIINGRLDGGQPVLWLLSGGSAILVAVTAARLISAADKAALTVGLIDERYGPPGHPDSNWTQLLAAGFSLPGARLEPVLRGLDFEATAEAYDNFYTAAVNHDTYKIGLLGMGADGHTAGLLPGSPAIDSEKYVDRYVGPDYKRITLSARGIKSLDKAVLYAAGKAKRQAIHNLTKNLDPAKQPVQLLKLVDDVDVYNDVIGEQL
jgi:6-phosphogluconolactonase/glucosamine-6-phosphate isomerase/deaminase